MAVSKQPTFREVLEEELLSCAICFDQLKCPKVLPCSHSFCESCIRRHFQNYKLMNEDRLSCPTCRELLPLPQRGLSGFMDDDSVLQVKSLLKNLFPDGIDDGESSKGMEAGALPHDMSEKRDTLSTYQSNLQNELTAIRGKILQVYQIENHVRFKMDKECQAVARKKNLPRAIPKDKVIEGIKSTHGLTMNQLAMEQEKLYKKQAKTKCFNNVLEELLKRCDPWQLDMIYDLLIMQYKRVSKVFDRDEDSSEACPIELSELDKTFNYEEPFRLSKQKPNFPRPDSKKKITCEALFKISGVDLSPSKLDYPTNATFTPDGDILVSDKNNCRILFFDREGNFKEELLKNTVKPRRAKVNMRDGLIYISDEFGECVKACTFDGQIVRTFGCKFFQSTGGLAFDENGNIVMTDTERCMVSVHHPRGGILKSFYYRGISDKVIPCPYFTAVNDDDQLIVSDYRNNCVKAFNHAGKMLFKIPALKIPRGVCCDPYGNILIAEGDAHRISMYNPFGKFMQVLLTEEDGLKYPMSIDMQHDGKLLVTQYGPFTAHEVLAFQVYSKKAKTSTPPAPKVKKLAK